MTHRPLVIFAIAENQITMGKGARVCIEYAKIESLTNVSLSERKGETDRAARAEAKLVWIMPSRDRGKQSQVGRRSLLFISET